jgi:hypothetical protein
MLPVPLKGEWGDVFLGMMISVSEALQRASRRAKAPNGAGVRGYSQVMRLRIMSLKHGEFSDDVQT